LQPPENPQERQTRHQENVLAKELGTRSVTVNAVAPGPVATELFLTGKSDELIQRLTKDIPLGRLGEPDDIALVPSFLASPNSGWINGQVIKVNGGRNWSTRSMRSTN
jgi:3-oxoacyl-[acyl-carrier protein] reductase